MQEVYLVIGIKEGETHKMRICKDEEVANNISLDLEEQGLEVQKWRKWVISMKEYQKGEF